MKFLSSMLYFANQVLTFYVPIFYTFKYLGTGDPILIGRILKFWTVLTLASIVQYGLAFILAEYYYIIIDLVLHLLLIWQEFTYSQQIYDRLIRPLYQNNSETINSLSKVLEEYFEEKGKEVQSKVSQSAGEKIKGFIGEILVGTLNPSNKHKNKDGRETRGSRYSSSEEDFDKED